MHAREIVLRQIRHCPTTPVPYTLSFEEVVAERLDEHYGTADWRDRIEKFIVDPIIVSNIKKIPTEQPGLERDPYGSLWRTDRRPFHLERPGLSEPTFDGYEWPKPEAFFADDKAVVAARELCRRSKDECFVLTHLGWGLFETCWGIRGFENVLMDIVEQEDFFEELLDRITDQFMAYLEFALQQLPDVDGIMFGDDWGDQRGVIVGPARWRRFFKPRYAKIYDYVHSHGKLTLSHCCGSIADILPDIIEIGLDVIESCQPEARGMSPYELKREFGDKITFWGGLGSQSTIPFGTPTQIHDEVGRLCREMGQGGGYILAPAKTLQPETPTANAVAIVEAFTNQVR